MKAIHRMVPSLILTISLLVNGCSSDTGGGGTTDTTTESGGNHPPVAVSDTVKIARNTATLIDVLANDTDDDGDPLTIKAGSLSAPDHNGTAVIENNKIRYTPATGYQGTETFSYQITDGNAVSYPATVTVRINHAPIAASQTLIPTKTRR